MLISLQQLQKRPVRFNVDIPAGEIEFDSKISQSSLIHAEGTAELLNHSLGEIRIEGKLNVTMAATCDRCLEAAAFPIESDFDLVYMPVGEATGGEDEIDESAIEVGFYEGNGLVLNDILREVVLLALPMRLTCSETCKGICPVCGENRNQRDCGCQTAPADDRWSSLKDFRAQIGSHN
ncbi:MAG: DUF177 domain-containing protein [Acidobacteriota bacterium]|nr:DUF177 domain-containing protein [Acidobacteriota bacterium]